jgi:hypothetical protein
VDARGPGDAAPESDALRARDANTSPDASDGSSVDPLCPTHVVFPSDSGAINVQTAYGIKGDGVTDVTAAIIAAIGAHIGPVGKYNENVLYFPNGTYLVHDTLAWKTATGVWGAFLTFEGECQGKTVIKLVDHATGYDDPTTPKAVLYTASLESPNANGSGAEAFINNILNLTVDTGTGNPGAIGIDYVGSNESVVGGVTIESGDGDGFVGLGLTRLASGPLQIRDLTITGFQTGISVAGYPVGVSMTNITLSGQKVAGLVNEDGVVAVENLTSTNAVPAVQNVTSNALLALIGANLSGGAGTTSAIQNDMDPPYSARLYARNVTTSGYKSAVENKGTTISGSTVAEFVSDPVLSLPGSGGPLTALDLPISQVPVFNDDDLADWASVTAFGATPDDASDDTAGVQAAIDKSGKPVVYLPAGTYLLSDTVHVRGSVVRQIISTGASITPMNGFPASSPAFRFESTGVASVSFERTNLTMNYNGSAPVPFPLAFEDAASVPLVLRDLRGAGGNPGCVDGTCPPAVTGSQAYTNDAGAGPLFLEDIVGASWTFTGQTVWARQFNPERSITITNDGGKLWILGLKSEGPLSHFVTNDGGETELLGASFLPNLYGQTTNIASGPAFLNTDSSQALVYATDSNNDYEVEVDETRSGKTTDLYRAYATTDAGPKAYPRPPGGSMVPLFVGRP